MIDERLEAESTPDGGFRVQGGGIDIRISREAIKTAQREDGLGFNYCISSLLHEKLPPHFVEKESPIEKCMAVKVHLSPMRLEDEDEER